MKASVIYGEQIYIFGEKDFHNTSINLPISAANVDSLKSSAEANVRRNDMKVAVIKVRPLRKDDFVQEGKDVDTTCITGKGHSLQTI